MLILDLLKLFSWQKWNPYKYRAHLTVAAI